MDEVGYSGKVGYLGPEGTFCHKAAITFFVNSDVEFVAYKTHTQVCQAVGKKEVKFGIVAIENNIKGVVADTALAIEDEAEHRGLSVCGETTLAIEFFYMSKPDKTQIVKALSHPAVFDQARNFVAELREQGITIENRGSTSEAAEEASRTPGVAAIASLEAEKLYGLERIIPGSVADYENNTTRFWILCKEHADSTGDDKTCLFFNLQHAHEGSLCTALSPFADRKINLLIIYPIPIPGKKWEYTFLVEFAGHIDDERMDDAWRELRAIGLHTTSARFLGSYPNKSIGVASEATSAEMVATEAE